MIFQEFQKITGVSRETYNLLCEMEKMLCIWSSKINLIGPQTKKDIWQKHFLESIAFENYIEENDIKIADIGSGAGFPGLILALLTHKKIHLIDSDQKKCHYLKFVSSHLNIDVQVIPEMIESIKFSYNVIVSRACASLLKLCYYTFPILSSTGKAIFIKGKKLNTEVALAKEIWDFDYKIQKSPYCQESQFIILQNLRKK